MKPTGQKRIHRSGSWDFALLSVLAALVLILMLADSSSLAGFLAPFRLVFGLVFVLFAPGYALQAALFPRPSDQSGVGRVALATGLSLVILPPLALILDKLPWGLSPWPIIISLILVTLTCSLAAIARRLRLPVQERILPTIQVDLNGWWADQGRTSRRLYILAAGALGVAVISAAAILILPKSGDRFTEFYLLGPEGQAQDYPRQAQAGQPLTVTMGIHNLEGVAVSYRLDIYDDQGLVGKAGPFQLENDAKSESPVTFSPLQTSEDAEVIFLLFRDNQPEPYRTLRLILNVSPMP